MRLTALQGLPLIVAGILVLAATISSRAQTAPTAAPPAAAPTSPPSASQVKQPEELQWNAVGATAQCVDGTFYHGTFNQHACADHHGVRRLLHTRDQLLIR